MHLDDLRQDAVLSKVFEIVNVLLSKEAATRRRNLTMRTYRVVPLSPKAGVVHWVSDTVPISNCLLDAHKRYGCNKTIIRWALIFADIIQMNGDKNFVARK